MHRLVMFIVPARTPRRHGFSLIEVLVAVTLIVSITGFLVATFQGSSRTGDEQARFTVSSALDAELTHWRVQGEFGDADALNSMFAGIDELAAVAAPTESTGSSIVSVGHSPQIVGLAVTGSTRCWLARITPTEVLWATAPAPVADQTAPPCTGTAATVITIPADSPQLGRSPDAPIRLDD